jgi:hypothetical protein
MYVCSVCGLLVGPEDARAIDEPSRPCPVCRDDALFDADELGLDPEDDDLRAYGDYRDA